MANGKTGDRRKSRMSMNSRLLRAYDEVAHIAARVRTLSPQATLDRGYSVVQKKNGSIVTDPTSLSAGEEIRLGKREIYVHYPDGMGRSKLKIPAAKSGTARNMNTVAKLAEMSGRRGAATA